MANLPQMTNWIENQRNQPYSNSGQVENALKVVAPWIAKNSACRINYHGGTAVAANCATGQIDIPRTGHLDEESLMKLRSWVYHESGHIAETTIKAKPPGAFGEVVNALEDRRMEAVIAKEHAGCRQVFNWSSRYYNKTIGGQIQSGEIDAPLWEALCAMGLQSEGLTLAWSLTPKAQAYFDAAYNDFCDWNRCDNTEEILELAEIVLKKMRIAKEEYEDQNQPEEEQSGGEESEDGESENGESEDGDGDGDGDGESEGEDGEEQEGSDGSGAGEEEEGEGGGESEGGGQSEGEDGEENNPQQGGQADIEEEGQEKETGGEEGEEGEEGEGDPENGEGQGKEEAGAGDKYYDTEYSDSNGSKKKSESEKNSEMDKEASGGKNKDEILANEIQEAIENLEPADREYTANKDIDKHEIVESTLAEKATYQRQKRELAKDITGMSRMLEQALRAMARCRKQPYMENGKIDPRRHVAIAKSLSRQVFHTTRKGQKLDTAVGIVIDESGSMGNYEEVRQLVIAISETLSAMKVPFEIIGTTTVHWGSDLQRLEPNGFSRVNPIHYRHYKLFDEQWSTVSQRIIHTGHHKHNVDGEAVEYMAKRLAQRKESRKIVFSLSDGLPDAGQGNGRLLGENITQVCKRSRAAGIEVYGFGIGTTQPEEFYGKEFFVHLDKYEGMGDTFFRKFADIITKGKFQIGAKA